MNSPAACRTYFLFIVRNTGNYYPRKHLNAHLSQHAHLISIGIQHVQRDEIIITDRLSHDRLAFGVFFSSILANLALSFSLLRFIRLKNRRLKNKSQEYFQSGLTVEYSERYKTLNTKNLCLKICMEVEKSCIITFLHRYFPELSVFLN